MQADVGRPITYSDARVELALAYEIQHCTKASTPTSMPAV